MPLNFDLKHAREAKEKKTGTSGTVDTIQKSFEKDTGTEKITLGEKIAW